MLGKTGRQNQSVQPLGRRGRVQQANSLALSAAPHSGKRRKVPALRLSFECKIVRTHAPKADPSRAPKRLKLNPKAAHPDLANKGRAAARYPAQAARVCGCLRLFASRACSLSRSSFGRDEINVSMPSTTHAVEIIHAPVSFHGKTKSASSGAILICPWSGEAGFTLRRRVKNTANLSGTQASGFSSSRL